MRNIVVLIKFVSYVNNLAPGNIKIKYKIIIHIL